MKDDKKYVWTVKMGDKGQIVIPKEARDLFDIKTGETLLLLGDLERGIAIVSGDQYIDFANAILNARGDK